MVTFSPFVILAVGFTNLAMLGWLAAAAAPLLIHLWSRNRYRETPWAAMQFLLAAIRKNARRLQLQQWLLLAVRTLIIMLTVLAVAEPYGERLLAGGTGAPRHKILVLDGSFSMGYRSHGATIFERARNLAAQAVRDCRPGDAVTVIDMSRPARLIVGPDNMDHTSAATQIESLAPSQTPADLPGGIALIQQELTAENTNARIPTQKEVYFITDLQLSTWGPAAPSPPTAPEPSSNIHPPPAVPNPQPEIAASIAALASRASLSMIDLGQPSASNLAVTNLSTNAPFITLGQEISFDATLHQFGTDARRQCKVEFLVDGVPIREQMVDIPAGSDVTVRFTHSFQSAGSHAICARAAGDRLEIDNSRWLVVPVREEVRVLCVAGRSGAAKYLADALNPNPTGNSSITPVIVSEGDLADMKLAGFDAVFLANVAQLTANEVQRLQRFIDTGGGLIIFLGDRVDTENYNSLQRIFPSATRNPPSESDTKSPDIVQPQSFLPARITELISEPQFGLDPLDYRHPIVAPFRGRERAGLLTTPVARYYRLEVPKDKPQVEVAAALAGRDPFIVTAPLGRGRIVLVATDGSLSSVDQSTGDPWTTWPTWPSFLPIVREMLSYAAGSHREHWQQLVGTSIASREPLGSSVVSLQVKRPDGRTAPLSLQPTVGGQEWTYSDTDASGIYSLEGLPSGQSQQFAVNVDTTESNLEKLDPRQLPSELIVRSTWQDSAATQSTELATQASWNTSILWVVLALVFVESFMAWYFGRGTA